MAKDFNVYYFRYTNIQILKQNIKKNNFLQRFLKQNVETIILLSFLLYILTKKKMCYKKLCLDFSKVLK